ncbi:FABP family protein [Miniimonas sp. S16]|uniref:FABP family protein n=1 Tax=Miniimonas sp. S16 TaxID=2171623 RepID=UPI000D52A2B7|nr:FABP family protein [Miniimonas sp. S16]
MTFTIADDVAPELYPLAWLLGSWRGPGVLAYPGIPERGIVADMVVTHDGGPYLAYTTTLRLGERVDHEAPFDPEALVAGEIWSRESGFWRPATGSEARPVQGAPADGPAPTAIEVLATDPSGFAAVLGGSAQGPRIDVASDWVASTATSPGRVTAIRRMYGWVRGEIFWAHELAAFGHELANYASGRLARVAD